MEGLTKEQQARVCCLIAARSVQVTRTADLVALARYIETGAAPLVAPTTSRSSLPFDASAISRAMQGWNRLQGRTQ